MFLTASGSEIAAVKNGFSDRSNCLRSGFCSQSYLTQKFTRISIVKNYHWRKLPVPLLLADYLRSKGLELYTAESIEKGWQLYVETQPDLIVSGIAIKFNNCGYTFLKQVRDRDLQQPFIVLSAQLNNSINRENAIRFGVNAYFDKPFEPDELYQKIESILYS